MSEHDELTRLKLLKLAQLEEQEKLRLGLPHLHLYPFYPWSRRFFESREKITVLCAANQISKSSTQMRKAIHWATSPNLWPELWPGLLKGQVPGQFWYLYPTRDIATIEFEEKWRQFLPAGEYKNHAQYGWDEEWDNKKIFAIHFKTGVTIYFKTYAQNLELLQSGTVFRLDCDEELDAHLFDELSLRVAATDGYMSFVFTATKGQEFWKQVVEDRTKLNTSEALAEVYQISMYDCQVYEDGSVTKWDEKRIKRIIAMCRSEAEVQRRVFGRFVLDEGLKYGLFTRTRNVVKPYAIPKDWLRYAGIDIGGGGAGHPSAICFIAVRPDFQKGAVYKFWRGSPGVLTSSQDVVQQYLNMRAGESVVNCAYDWAAKDFSIIAARAGVGVRKAEKSHDIGESILNSLFRNQMLDIFDTFEPLVQEFLGLLITADKKKAKDDGIDACFISDTLITTKRGEVPIIDVKIGDEVLTRAGWRRVLDSGLTNANADTVTLNFANGFSVTCTDNHRFFTKSGWLMARDIPLGESVICLDEWKKRESKQSSSTASNTEDTRTQNTKLIEDISLLTLPPNEGARLYCIGISGRVIMEKFQKAFTFITKTATRSITTSRIWSYLAQLSTCLCTQKSEWQTLFTSQGKRNTSLPFDHSRKSGMARERARIGTRLMETEFSEPRIGTRSKTSASSVTKPIWWTLSSLRRKVQDFVQTRAKLKADANPVSMTLDELAGAESNSNQINTPGQSTALVSVSINIAQSPVYNLTVDQDPEYFANGLLAHNCRYCAASIPWDWANVTVSDDIIPIDKIKTPEEERAEYSLNVPSDDNLEDEFSFWNDLMGN